MIKYHILKISAMPAPLVGTWEALKRYEMIISFREAKELSLVSLYTNITDKEAFVLLHDLNSSNNLNFP